MRRNAIVLFLLLFCSNLSAQNHPNLYKNTDEQAMNYWVDSVFNRMTTDEKIGQLFMIVADPNPNFRSKVLGYIHDQKIGGVLFSSGDLMDEAESINLYQKTSRIPLFISADAEWGLSMRLKNTPRFPKNMMLGAVSNNRWLQLYGEEKGRECRELGVQINFAPVLDVNNNPENPIIGLRSYGEEARWLTEKALAFSAGMEKMGVISVGKHFPGHGDTSFDSHHVLPQIDGDRKRLDAIELYPFKQYISSGFSGIMIGHLSIPALDNNSRLPASLSHPIVTDLLTDELDFQGLKFTDGLQMQGVKIGKLSTCVASLLAGNDILLGPEKPVLEFEAVKKAVSTGEISLASIEEKCRKVLAYKYVTGLNRYTPIETYGLRERINSDYSDWLAQKLNEEAITLLKNKKSSIPLKQLQRKIAVVSLGAMEMTDFQTTMGLYDEFDFFQSETADSSANLPEILKNYDALVLAIHSKAVPEDTLLLQKLAEQQEVHLCFFISPYFLKNYKTAISSAKSVVLGYENTPYSQKAAAEVIMGGLPAKGKLPVSIDDIFDYGDGLTTEKVRLSYQHPMESGIAAQKLDEIETIVQEGIAEQAFPGCQVLVAKNGVVVYNKSFGTFDYDRTHRVENTDIYDLASVTKATATLSAVMKLQDEKKIKLQDPLSKYIPELQTTDKEKITVQNALFHETGLAPFIPFYRVMNYAVSPTPTPGMERQVAENFYIADDFDRQILQHIAQSKLNKTADYTYSDLNFMLLGKMVENVSGEPLDQFVEQNFFAQLGAASTTFLPLRKRDCSQIAPTENDESLRKQLVVGYPHDESAAFMGGVSGNAGLFSNANDLAKLLQMYLNDGEYGGEKYVSSATAKLFTQTKSVSGRRYLGFDTSDMGKTVYGHTGFTGTCFWIDPDNQLIYIFLSNRVYPSRSHTALSNLSIRPRIQRVIYEAMK
ncbi:beta-N-acetylglucosaminidase [Bacteroidia bacterium]|nr:beta-N-acetylglucosaminidase [Bacteroidia bacterium]